MANNSEVCLPDVCLQRDGRKTGFSYLPPVRAAGLFQLRKADVELSKTQCKMLQHQQIHGKSSTSGPATQASSHYVFLVCIKYLVHGMHLINNKDLSHSELYGIAHCCTMITSTCPLGNKILTSYFPYLGKEDPENFHTNSFN